jgi:MFS transporter, Spinster family, sphingosine-1-phosphate transporter
VGVISGAVMLFLALNVPVENQGFFLVMMLFTALFIPFASPNVIASVYDIALPEVRSTALAVQYFIENSGAALAPLLAGFIARETTLGTAILSISVTAWIIGAIAILFVLRFLPADIHALRSQLQERADAERQLQASV